MDVSAIVKILKITFGVPPGYTELPKVSKIGTLQNNAGNDS